MPHDPGPEGGPGRLPPKEALAHTARVTSLAIVVAGALALMKLVGFWMSGSVALLASLADSALDCTASLVTFFAVRYAATPADAEHRFGHGKAEAFAGLFQAGLITLSATLVARESIERFLDPQPILNGVWPLAVMGVSLALTGGLIWAQTRAVERTGSVAVAGDRAHYIADLAANLAVIAGVGLSLAGLGWADPLVGLGVAVWLLWGAWQVGQGALDQMMDRELDDDARERIRALAAADPRVISIHNMRTRAAGPIIHVQFHAELADDLSLRDAHDIMVAIERRILVEFPGADVLIHPDPVGALPHGNPHLGQG